MKSPASPPAGPNAKPRHFWLRVVVSITVLAAATAAAVYWLKSSISAKTYSADPTVRQFVIGDEVLDIPLNTMRFAEQRRLEALEQIDLVLLWPTGAGYSEADATYFEHPEQTSNLIFATLTKRDMKQEMNSRYQPIYRRLLTGQPRNGPANLLIQPLKPGSGYDGEELAIAYRTTPTGKGSKGSNGDTENTGNPIWVARCQLSDSTTNPTCLRDLFFVRDLTLRYRFSTTLLPHWLRVENLVVRQVNKMIVQ